MKYIFITIIGLIAAILLYLALDHLMKRYKKPYSAADAIWKAVYFIQLGEYDRALSLLEAAEKDFAVLPEEMCDLCIQKAEALKKLERQAEAVEAYEMLHDALQQCDRPIRRNDTLLAELKECYTAANRATDFKKWEDLFDRIDEGDKNEPA